MEYKELIERLNEWHENLISEMCADDVFTCDDLCGCTSDCIVVQASTAIKDLIYRAEEAEARAEKADSERYEVDEIDFAPVVHGKWFLLNKCSNEGVYCSNCHKKVYRSDYANQKLKSKYCSNCGARMDGAK